MKLLEGLKGLWVLTNNINSLFIKWDVIMFINIRALRMRSVDGKSSLIFLCLQNIFNKQKFSCPRNVTSLWKKGFFNCHLQNSALQKKTNMGVLRIKASIARWCFKLIILSHHNQPLSPLGSIYRASTNNLQCTQLFANVLALSQEWPTFSNSCIMDDFQLQIRYFGDNTVDSPL